MKIAYKQINFKKASLKQISLINDILKEYEAQGFELTLRQVYYQLVARGIIENTERSYKNTGALVNDARLAGLIDWHAIVDRTRSLRGNSHWDDPESIIDSCVSSYMLDRWEDQPKYVEVWVEKDALVGIVSQAANDLDVRYFSCRGYTSQSEMWQAAQRFIREKYRQERVILHLGDHDPSGIDMTRDIQERLSMFGADVKVKRIALTQAQIEQYNPPPNPTKVTDSRSKDYIEKYGHECWELDALEPKVITELIKKEVSKLCDPTRMAVIEERESQDKNNLVKIKDNFDEVCEFVEDK